METYNSKKRAKQSHCFVPNCKTSRSRKRRQKLITLFCVPKDIALRQAWEIAIQRTDKTLEEHCVVCELHFESKFIERYHKNVIQDQEILTPRNNPKLLPGAMPSIFPASVEEMEVEELSGSLPEEPYSEISVAQTVKAPILSALSIAKQTVTNVVTITQKTASDIVSHIQLSKNLVPIPQHTAANVVPPTQQSGQEKFNNGLPLLILGQNNLVLGTCIVTAPCPQPVQLLSIEMLRNAKLPTIYWYCVSYESSLDIISFVKWETHHEENIIPDKKVVVKKRDHEITCTVYVKIVVIMTKKIEKREDLESILMEVNNYNVCTGVGTTDEFPFASKHVGDSISIIDRRILWYSHCIAIVDGRKKSCAMCTKYRKNLLNKRLDKVHEVEKTKPKKLELRNKLLASQKAVQRLKTKLSLLEQNGNSLLSHTHVKKTKKHLPDDL